MNKYESAVKYYSEQLSECLAEISKNNKEKCVLESKLEEAKKLLNEYNLGLSKLPNPYPKGYFTEGECGLSKRQVTIANEWINNHCKEYHEGNAVLFSINWGLAPGIGMMADCRCNYCYKSYIEDWSQLPDSTASKNFSIFLDEA